MKRSRRTYSTHLSTDGTCQLKDVQNDIQQRLKDTHRTDPFKTILKLNFYNGLTEGILSQHLFEVWYLAEVGVEVHHTVAEFLHILCQ